MAGTNITPHRLVSQEWLPDLATPGGRASRRARRFEAYVPEPIADRDWQVSSSLAEVLALAERSCAVLEAHTAQVGLDTVARQLLGADSVASSRIEGLVLSHRQLAKASIVATHDVTARSVLGNVAAIQRAYEWAAGGKPFTSATISEIHRILFAGTRDERLGGDIRATQNWIGGGASSPLGAEFVPPPVSEVEALVADLAEFCNRTDLPPVMQAAVAHAQFETIHPFMDGNGRTGRGLTGMVLIKRGVCRGVIPPVSLVLAGRSDRYVDGLMSYRLSDPADWFEFFADSVTVAATSAGRLADAVRALHDRWFEQAGRPRAGSAPRRLIDALATHPVLTLATAIEITGLSDEACRLALNRLADAHVINETTAGSRNRVWECVGLFDLLDTMEPELGDSARSPAATR